MTSAEQNELEHYRVIVLGRSGTELLLVPNGARFMLPSVAIPRCQRVAENLTAAVRSDWGEEIVCLSEAPSEPPADAGVIRYQTAEHLRTRNSPKMPTRWLPVSRLCPGPLVDGRDYAAIKQVTETCKGEIEGSSAGPFVRLGWFSELCNWMGAVVEPMGFHLTGEFRQLNASPSFSLVRFETDGPALWFKAVGEPNQREFAITCALAQLFPDYLPGMLAVRPEWNGWLTQEAEGSNLGEVQGIRGWHRAATALAELQMESIPKRQPILDSGTRDLTASALAKLVRPFMAAVTQLMERQVKIPPPVLDRNELLLLENRIQEALEVVGDLRIPDALGHLDLNPENIFFSPRGCVFLDWAEGFVGHPFFSFQYLLEHFRRGVGTDPAAEERLVAAYVGQWQQAASRAAIADSLAVTPLLAVFAYAAGSDAWKNQEGLGGPNTAGYLRSLTRRMSYEANQLSQRRSLCLS